MHTDLFVSTHQKWKDKVAYQEAASQIDVTYVGDTMNKHVNAPQLNAIPRRTDLDRRMWVEQNEWARNWWQGTTMPLYLFVQENRAQVDEWMDKAGL